ncbi:MAG: EscU/YscU/HrcU family type III secretion system export apparatus switch protein [Peptostreptococcaceae bacterium]|nr:EscU/YscU/HrcU family type III secretion system export apparatus switch protein [Peptostreptococcaceae bacterium]
MSAYKNDLKKKAVALRYDEDKNAAPIIVASGMGYMAEKILDVAQKNDITVHEDASLATILTQLELGSPIPEELYHAIIDIYVYLLNYSAKKTT